MNNYIRVLDGALSGNGTEPAVSTATNAVATAGSSVLAALPDSAGLPLIASSSGWPIAQQSPQGDPVTGRANLDGIFCTASKSATQHPRDKSGRFRRRTMADVREICERLHANGARV